MNWGKNTILMVICSLVSSGLVIKVDNAVNKERIDNIQRKNNTQDESIKNNTKRVHNLEDEQKKETRKIIIQLERMNTNLKNIKEDIVELKNKDQ